VAAVLGSRCLRGLAWIERLFDTGDMVGEGQLRDPTPSGGPTAYWQKVLNARFPARPRGLADRPDPVRGEARIVWERDGEEWVPATAIRWDRQHVLVRIGDRRCSALGTWLAPDDFRRLDTPAGDGTAPSATPTEQAQDAEEPAPAGPADRVA
jgi:hypothetical protein